MKKNLKLFTIGAAMLLSLGALVSCGGNTDKPVDPDTPNTPDDPDTPDKPDTPSGTTVELVFSGPADSREFYNEVFAKFKAAKAAEGDKNTYNITYVEFGEDKVDSLVTDWKSAAAPDVYCYASDKILPLYQKGALAELGGAYKTFVTTANNQVNVDLATFNGKVLAYPYDGSNTYFLYYDKSVFTTAPKTWEEVFAKAAETNKKFAYPLKTGFYSGALVTSFGAGWEMTLDNSGKVTEISADFDTDKGIKAGKAMLKIMKDKSFQNDQAAPTDTNKLVACVDGSWNLATYKEAMGENFGYTIMPTITIDNETVITKSFLGGKLLGVNPLKGGDDRLVAAHELAQFVTSEDMQLFRFEEKGTLPTNIEALKTSEIASSEMAQIIDATNAADGYLAQGALPAGIWSAPETLAASIDDGSTTEANINTAMEVLNTTIEKVSD